MATRSPSLKLGLIGCGWVTETFHVRALRALPTVEVVAVADRDPDRRRRVAEPLRVERRHADYGALLDDPATEAVGIWVPAEGQLEVARAALTAGKHVFIDKPLTFDLGAWARLAEQAARCDRRIMVVGLPRRWHRLAHRARDLIRQGALGKLQLIRTVVTGRNPERLNHDEMGGPHAARGLLYQFGVHHFDMWHFLLQREVDEIVARRSAEDSTIAVTARMSGDVLASSTFSECESEHDEIEICGQAGRLRLSLYRFDGFEHCPGARDSGDLHTRLRQAARTLRELPHGLSRLGRGGEFIDSYRVGWQQLVEALRQGARPPCTLEDGRRALQVVLAAMEAAKQGRPVSVHDVSHEPR